MKEISATLDPDKQTGVRQQVYAITRATVVLNPWINTREPVFLHRPCQEENFLREGAQN